MHKTQDSGCRATRDALELKAQTDRLKNQNISVALNFELNRMQTSIQSPNRLIKVCSSKTSTPRLSAFASFEPAPGPATTQCVF